MRLGLWTTVFAVGCFQRADVVARSGNDTHTPSLPVDADGDGFPSDVDCDDTDDGVFPGAPDLCGDDRVTDCDRDSDDGLVTLDGLTGYDDLADALADAGAGSTLLLCAGTHTGPFDVAIPVTLESYAGRAVTTVSGGGIGSALAVVGGTRIRGLTIRHGEAERGGGVLVLDGVVEIEDCIVTSNSAGSGGGIAVAPGATVIVRGSSIEANVADDVGGGISAEEGAVVDLVDSTVTGNSSEAGGGVMLVAASLAGGVISGNQVRGDGVGAPWGGVVVGPYGGGGVSTLGAVTIRETVVRQNRGHDGGGLSVLAGTALLDRVDVQENVGDDSGLGGGLYVHAATVTLVDTVVSGNVGGNGGGAHVDRGSLIGGTFDGNQVQAGFGGGVHAVFASVEGAVVTRNGAPFGGGVYAIGDCTLTDLWVEDNIGALAGGGLTVVSDEGWGVGTVGTRVLAGTIQGNGSSFGAGVLVPSSEAAVLLEEVDIVDNVAAHDGGGIHALGSVVVRGGSVVHNSGIVGGGAYVASAGRLVSESADWGTAGYDNLVDDVFAGSSHSGYALASFECTAEGCTP